MTHRLNLALLSRYSLSWPGWIAVGAVCLLCAPVVTEAADDPVAANPRPRLLVLDLRVDDVAESTARTVQDLLTAEIAKLQRYDVISGADLARLVELETQRQLTDCDADDSCLAEIAGALGAERVVFGSVGRLGELTVISLSLFDTQALRAVRRTTLQLADLGELPRRLPGAVAELFDGTRVEEPASIAEEPGGAGPWLAVAGGLGLGSAALLAGLGTWLAYLPYETTAQHIVELERNAPASLAEAQVAQADLDQLRGQLIWWTGATVATAILSTGLLVAGLWIGDGELEREKQP